MSTKIPRMSNSVNSSCSFFEKPLAPRSGSCRFMSQICRQPFSEMARTIFINPKYVGEKVLIERQNSTNVEFYHLCAAFHRNNRIDFEETIRTFLSIRSRKCVYPTEFSSKTVHLCPIGAVEHTKTSDTQCEWRFLGYGQLA